MRSGHHTERNRHWTIQLQNGRVATRLAHGPIWRVVHAERNHAPSHSSRVSDCKISRQLRQFPRRREIRTASNVQHPARSGIGAQNAYRARGRRAFAEISLFDLPYGAEAPDSFANDRRDTILRSIRPGSVALEEGTVVGCGSKAAQNSMMTHSARHRVCLAPRRLFVRQLRLTRMVSENTFGLD